MRPIIKTRMHCISITSQPRKKAGEKAESAPHQTKYLIEEDGEKP